jgi:hypothetical protein
VIETINNQLHQVRETGETSMFSVPGIQAAALAMGLYELYFWIEKKENRQEHQDWVFGIATVEPDPEDPFVEDITQAWKDAHGREMGADHDGGRPCKQTINSFYPSNPIPS